LPRARHSVRRAIAGNGSIAAGPPGAPADMPKSAGKRPPLSKSIQRGDPDPMEILDPRDSPSPFGVLVFLPWYHDWNDHHFGEREVKRAVDLMAKCGVAWVRMDFLWSDL